MTKDDVIRLARMAGLSEPNYSRNFWVATAGEIQRFAAMVIEESQKVSTPQQPAQKKHEIVQDPAEIHRVFEIDEADYPPPDSGFAKLEAL